jgi:hypothetical protein
MPKKYIGGGKKAAAKLVVDIGYSVGHRYAC